MLTNLLIYRLVIFNMCGFAVVAWAWGQGYVRDVFEGDISRLSYVIAALFAVGTASLAVRAVKVARLMNAMKARQHVDDFIENGLVSAVVNGAKLEAKAAHLDDIAEWLVTLGLLGTVIGFSVALSGVDQGSLAEAAGVQAAAAKLMEGMRIAFNTTLAGGFLGLWSMINARILATATSCLIEDAR